MERFEELKKDTKVEFDRILDFYGINLSSGRVDKIVEKASGKGTMVKNVEAAKILPRGFSSNFRSGKVAGWKEELSASHIKTCKELMGDALIELGYEKDLNW